MMADQLLTELEHLNHAARTRRMTVLGRLPEAEREPLLNELATGSVYERRLVLASTFGSRDAGRVMQAALDASGSVHGPATGQVARLCSGEQLLRLLRDLPAARHRPLLARWSRAARPVALVDAWIGVLLQSDRRGEVWPLLAYASPERVAGLLPEALTEGLAPDWARLTRWHPGLVGRELLRQATESREPNPGLTVRVNAVLGLLAGRERGLALALLRELERTTPLGSLNLQPLAAVAAPDLAALLLKSADQARLSLTGQLRKLSAEQVGALMRQRPSVLPDAERAYSRLDRERRQHLAAVFMAALTLPEGLLPLSLAASLPAELRVSEARRHLALPVLQTRPLVRLPYAGLLPWEEARAVLDASLRGPDADTRGEALSALIFSLRYERERQGELLAMLTARRNEQDPVRNRMLNGLAALPPGLWQQSSLDTLGEVIQAALNAADLSPGTAQAAERLLVGLLPFQPGWGAAWLAKVVQARGQVNLGRLEPRLTAGTAATLVTALLPVFKTWETREREGQLLAALRSLGRFVNDAPELLALLERLVQGSVVAWTGVGALGVLAEHAPERFAALVPKLLERDGSWATQPLVHDHLHRHRQDLLTPYLGRQSFRGRFSTGKTRFVLPFVEGFQRWTLSQQQVFAQTLIEVSRDSVRDNPGVVSVLHQLTALPSPVSLELPPARPSLLVRLTGAVTSASAARPVEDPPLRRLIQLADLRNENLALRDTALRMLGRLDEGRGLPALLDTLDDDRARISVYVLRRPLLNLPPAAALGLLLQVPRAKVTVFKEVVRLVGDLPGEAAYRALLEFSAQELHRDVRVALLCGLWNHLNRPETWPLLLAAARSADAALSDGLVRLPAQNVRAEYRGEHLALLRALLTHLDPLVRLETLQAQTHAQGGVNDPDRRLLGVLLQSLASPHAEEAQAAARLVFASYTGRDAPAVSAALSGLLPQRRALVGAVDALQAAASASRLKGAPFVRAILTVLASDPLTLPLQVRLAVSTLSWTELAERLLGWASGGQLHPDALTAAVNAMTGARHRTDVTEVETLERLLAAGPPEARRLALAALVLAAQAPGTWTPERLARLRGYRADPSVLVAGAAAFTLPDAELAAED
ncbi:hypothetical protein [Deinococcus altitudinis]|uniref:hypothetical protein n=1 Tax=Deinococcus altitudinis TaxID=468914 RepID=UPI003892B14C